MCNGLSLRWLMNPPGEVEERETNAVFDEDGKVIHIQHGIAGKDDRRRHEEDNGKASSICVCTSYISWFSCSAGHHPSISHWPLVSLVGSAGGRHTPVIAPVRDGKPGAMVVCLCVVCLTFRAVKRFKPQLVLTISEDGVEFFLAVFIFVATKPRRGLRHTHTHTISPHHCQNSLLPYTANSASCR